MLKYRYNNKFNKNDYKPVNNSVNETETSNRFKDFLINLYNINNETVTKLEKSKVKQLYFTNFQNESQSNIILNGYFI